MMQAKKSTNPFFERTHRDNAILPGTKDRKYLELDAQSRQEERRSN